MRIAVLHDRLNPTVAAAIDRLRARGVLVEEIGPDVPAAELADLQPAHDLYYLKTSAEPLLTLAGVLHAAGAKTINPYPNVAMLSNKLVATAMLRRAGLPVPETWIANDALALAKLLDAGPLILKPCRGSRGRGIRIVRHAGELAGPIDVPVLAQRYHPGDGMDRKLYCIGDRVFGLLRPWPCVSWDEKLRHGTPFAPDERLAAAKPSA
jgi:ribosomal protein S6--L-glutamate ligase